MAQIKLRGRLDTFYKVRVVLILSFAVSFILTTNIGQRYFPKSDLVTNNIVAFYSNSNILNFYGTIMGLLMAAYTVLISMIPIFHPDSLKQPIFGQINRLFVFTIMIGLVSMLLNFASFIVDKSSFYFVFLEVFLFISLITGIIFSVLSLSDIFNILRGKKISREIPRESGSRGSRTNQESEKNDSGR
ncbi:MAG: hypothetical protein M1375_00215 [Candidatus Thermoplasmatota archaeon]|jgi:hypothetical protein|nr:hypothetical protein [Candidatus Thermoplasmatota archaeon]MCL5790385.1 hypothetical protein [Candidatus Thermoplasmatota archaeon]